MKKTLTTIIGVVAILLAITACQPKYVIFPFPGGTNTPSGNADNEITTFAALKDALENGGYSSKQRLHEAARRPVREPKHAKI